MKTAVTYYGRQFAGSRTRCLSMITCQLGAWAILMVLTGWRYSLEFGLFMVLAPAAYLWVIHGLTREAQKNEPINN